MVRHIVVYTLKEGVDKDAAVKLIASKLEPLVGQIPGLRHMDIGGGRAGGYEFGLRLLHSDAV